MRTKTERTLVDLAHLSTSRSSMRIYSKHYAKWQKQGRQLVIEKGTAGNSAGQAI